MHRDHNCNIHQDKLRCCHSSEAILLTLSRFPWRLSIKELSELTKFHRNTLRKSLKNLKENNKIQFIGDNKSSNYFYGGVKDFYRRQARAIADLPLPPQEKSKIAKIISYNLVKNTLKDALDEGPEFNHTNLIEALVHVKMAYPFSDMILNENGKVESSTKFSINEIENLNPNDFKLLIHSCLCQGKTDKLSTNKYIPYHDMVIGALEGAIEGACGLKTKINWLKSEKNKEFGDYCEYRVKGIYTPSEDNSIPILANRQIIL